MNDIQKRTNLNVLKRHDGSIKEILDSASHCVVYDFDPQKSSWVTLSASGVVGVDELIYGNWKW
jgi:hypothetical protein